MRNNNASVTDEFVEKPLPVSDFAPDCIADPGNVRQGGLHRVLPWFLGKIFGDGA